MWPQDSAYHGALWLQRLSVSVTWSWSVAIVLRNDFAIRRIVTAMMLSHREKSTIRVVLKLRCHSKLNECHCLTVELSLILFAVLRFSPLIISVPSYCLPQQIGRNMISKWAECRWSLMFTTWLKLPVGMASWTWSLSWYEYELSISTSRTRTEFQTKASLISRCLEGMISCPCLCAFWSFKLGTLVLRVCLSN